MEISASRGRIIPTLFVITIRVENYCPRPPKFWRLSFGSGEAEDPPRPTDKLREDVKKKLMYALPSKRKQRTTDDTHTHLCGLDPAKREL